VIPDLALSWAVDAKDKTKWVFKLRPGVKFHDGSAFNADAVVWNVTRCSTRARRSSTRPGGRDRLAHAHAAQRPQDRRPDRGADHQRARSFLPINLTNLFMASPAHWEKKLRRRARLGDRPGRAQQAGLDRLCRRPSGTGPFKAAKFVPRERLEW
jgi:hypothetical protein